MQPVGYNWDHNSRYAGVTKNPFVKWTYQTKGVNPLPLVIDRDGTVITTSRNVSADTSEIYAINSDGSLKWKTLMGGQSLYTSPVISADKNLIMQDNYSLININSDNGTKMSFSDSFINKINYFYEPVIDREGTVYTAGVGPTSALIAFKPDGKVKWSTGNSSYYKSDMVLSKEGKLYFKYSGKGYNLLTAYNSVNGNKLWDYGIEVYGSNGIGTVPAIGSDGTIYIVDASGYIHAINPDGSVKWKKNYQIA